MSSIIIEQNIKNKNNSNEFADNILGADSSKKKDLANIIKEVNGLSQYLFDEDTRVKLKSNTARAKAVAEHIEIRIKNNFKQTKAKEQEETLPPNIIRIETEDESEDFIEIELPLIYDPPLQDMSAMFIPASKIVGSIIKGTKGVANLGRNLTIEEVLGIVDKLKKVFNRNGEDTNIRLVKSKKELNKVWEQISQNEKDIKLDKDYKGNLMKYKYLDDATTRIQYRTHSSEKSNNLPTIDIHNKVEGIERKIHIDIHQNKGVRQ